MVIAREISCFIILATDTDSHLLIQAYAAAPGPAPFVRAVLLAMGLHVALLLLLRNTAVRDVLP